MSNDLGAGSIAFTGFNADGDDSLSFVSFSDITAGTVIHFSDNQWNGTSFATDENAWSWTATGDIAAGTIISMTGLGAGGTPASNLGTVVFDSANARDIADINEVVYAYTGDAAAPVFLTAITNGAFAASLGRGTLVGTGLTNGVDAKQLASSADIAAYVGDRSSLASIEDYKANIYAASNWKLQGGTGDQSQDGSVPDLPFSTQAFTTDPTAQRIEFASVTASIAEGDSGDTVLTLTLNRIGSTAGVTTFSGTVPDVGIYGYANADDFGGAMPTFSGSFADGASTATVTIHIKGDTAYEPDELFYPTLTTVESESGLVYIGSKATVEATIVNDEPVQFVGFAEDSLAISQTEGNAGDVKTFTFVVERSRGIDGDLSFSGTISLDTPGSADAVDFGGTAPLTFSGVILAGETTATVTITTTGDVTLEGNDTFRLQLTNASSSTANTTIVLTYTQAVGTIVNDDPLHIGAGETVTSPLTIGDGDHLTIDQGGKLAVPDPLDGSSISTIFWTGGTTLVDNAGSIGVDSIGYQVADANGVTGSFTFNNAATGVTLGSIGFTYLGNGSSVTVNNAGLMDGGVGYALNFTDIGKVSTVVVNNLAGGLITNTQANVDVVRGGSNMTLNNAGTIRSTADADVNGFYAYGGDAVDYTGSTGGTVHNLAGGVIEASRHAVTNKRGITVINDAGASMIGRNGSAVNVDNDGSVADTVYVTNRGTMIGASAGYDDSDGDAIDADGLLSLNNYGVIKGLGANGYHNGEPNVSEAIAIGGGSIVNNAAGEIYGYGRAIQVDNSSNGPALGATTIVNDGLIQGDGHGPEGVEPEDAARFDLRGNEAINIVGDYEDFVGNNSTGRIIGGVSMGGGRDTLNNSGSITATGGSAIDMGAGNDQVNLYVGATVQGTILLGDGDDVALGTSAGGFVIDGGAGNDSIFMSSVVFGGDDILSGGEGDDYVYGGLGNDLIDGGTGNDTLSGEDGDDIVDGGAGDDHIMGGRGADILRGGEGNDRIEAGAGDIVDGGSDDDTIEVSTWNGTPVSIDGGDGVDTVKLLGPGTGGMLGELTGIEKIDVQEGTWGIGDSAATITIGSGASLVVNGVVDGSTVAQGGAQYVYGSVASSSVSGEQMIGAGATATDTTVDVGGSQTVHGGAVASDTTLAGGSQTVWGSADDTTVEDGGLQYVHGSVTDTTIDAGGQQNVYADGTATGTKIGAGGFQLDWGAAVDTTIDGGTQFVYGTATNTSIVSGIQHVGAGATATDTTIGSGGTEYVHSGGSAHDVTFAGPNAALVLDDYADFTGTISGWQFGDSIDFGNIAFDAASTTFGYTENADHSGGTLTITDGTHTATLALLGQYAASDFALSSDGHGGTLLTDPTVAQGQMMLAPAHA